MSEDGESSTCAGCGKHKKDLSRRQKLCDACRDHFPMLRCRYCLFDVYQLPKDPPQDAGDGKTICIKCKESVRRHGTPRICKTCNAPAAFGDKTDCPNCESGKKKYGAPVECEECKRVVCFKHGKHTKNICAFCLLDKKENKKRKREDDPGTSTSTKSAPEPPKKMPAPQEPDSILPPGVSSKDIGVISRMRAELTDIRARLQTKESEVQQRDKEIASLKGAHIIEMNNLKYKTEARLNEFQALITELQSECHSLRTKLQQAQKARQPPAAPAQSSASSTPFIAPQSPRSANTSPQARSRSTSPAPTLKAKGGGASPSGSS